MWRVDLCERVRELFLNKACCTVFVLCRKVIDCEIEGRFVLSLGISVDGASHSLTSYGLLVWLLSPTAGLGRDIADLSVCFPPSAV